MLSHAQLAAWERDGFLVLDGFVDAGRCAELKAHVESLLAGIDPDADDVTTVFSTTNAAHGSDEWFLTSGDKVRWFFEDGALGEDGSLTRPLPLAVNKLGHAMHDLDPVFDAFSRTPQMAELATDIGFAEPRLLQSMYIFKQPGIGGEVVCHTDHTFLWTEPQSVVGFWVAVEEATLANGCLHVLPGGHRIAVKSRFRLTGDRLGTTFDVFDDTPYPIDRLVPVEADVGTLVLLHGTLPHWSAPNTSAVSRHAYTLHVIEGSADYLADNWLQRDPSFPLRGFG